jgi:peptidoglycan/xylan/chitin deacetylase (PgdA/CDA1 family)
MTNTNQFTSLGSKKEVIMDVKIEKKSIPILMYHSISNSSNGRFKPFTVTPEAFAMQMEYLHQQGYTTMTVTQAIEARAKGAGHWPLHPVVLTFDDGFADFWHAALPILQQYAFNATLYLTTGYIGNTSCWLRREREMTRPMLTWAQIAAIQSWGIECASHTHSHPQLDMLPLARAREEIVQSKDLLQDQLGQAISSFAYPYGYSTVRVRHLVQEAGYTSACAVRHALSSEDDDAFSLVRLMVRPDTSLAEFAALLTGTASWDAVLHTVYTRTRTPLWRLVRLCRRVAPVQGGQCA